jgi:hypothetical protein
VPGQKALISVLTILAALSQFTARAADTPNATYWRSKIATTYPVACGSVQADDDSGKKAQSAARDALAGYAGKLLALRQEQLKQATNFTPEQMDTDEKAQRVDALTAQIADLQALQKLGSDTKAQCPGLDVPPADVTVSNLASPGASGIKTTPSSSPVPSQTATKPEVSAVAPAAPVEVTSAPGLVSKASGPASPKPGGANPGEAAPPSENAAPDPAKLKLSIPITDLEFGHQAMQTESASQTVTITNISGGSITLTPPISTITSNDYHVTANTCNNTIADKGNCSFKVTYAPFSMNTGQAYIALVPPSHISEYSTLLADLVAKRAAALKAKSDLDNVKNKDDGLKLAFDDAQLKLNSAGQAIVDTFDVISLSGTPDHWKYPLTRAVVGLDLSAPSSRTVKQSYFVDFDLLAPIHLLNALKKNEDPLENSWWFWLNPRITSLPQSTSFSALSTINETGSFFSSQTTQGKVNDLVQGLDVQGGLEYVLVKPRDGIPWWAEYPNTQARLSPSLIAGVGISTPFSTDSTDVTSQVNQSICDAFKLAGTPASPPPPSTSQGLSCTLTAPGGSTLNTPAIVVNPLLNGGVSQKNFVTFFTPDRSRFFRSAYAGFRLKTYFFSKDVKADCIPPVKRANNRGDCDAPYDIFPGILDVTFGKDEAVTGGRMSTWLLRVDAVYPLPFYQGIHIFGSIYTALSANRANQPYNSYTVQAPAAGAANTDLNTFRFPLQPLNRDYYRVGLGVDLIQVFKKAASGGQPSTNAPAPPNANALSSVGNAPVSMNPSSLIFSGQTQKTPSKETPITLKNNLSTTLNISKIEITGINADDFKQSNACAATLASGGTCPINIVFTPAASGSRSAVLSVTDDAKTSPQTVTLSGTGK